MMNRLVPKVFYDHLADGLDLFVGGMGFDVRFQDATMAIVERDTAKAMIVESAEFAAKDRPEIGIETDTIDALFTEISGRRPDLLHPNLRAITLRPWGAREFALRDKTDVCVVFRQF
jgi:hypothetical protein